MAVKWKLWLVLAIGLSGCSSLPCERDADYLDANSPPAPKLPPGVEVAPLVDLDAMPAPSLAQGDPRRRRDGTCLSMPPPAAIKESSSPPGN